jgi:uncharacterized damage-inducible protein DinB
MTFPYSEQNAASRRRLVELTAQLSGEDLARTTEYGWTVAALLAHLAFWDQRMIVILRRWLAEGFDSSPMDSQVVNDALKVVCHAIEPRTAVELCLSSAEAADAEFDTLTPGLVKELEQHAAATETQFRMNRSLHRNAHLDDIEALLAPLKNAS